MSEIAPISASNVAYEAALVLLKQTLEVQQQAMENLMAAMGVGQKIDIEA